MKNGTEQRRTVTTLMQICYGATSELTDVDEKWRSAVFLWSIQVNVAAVVEDTGGRQRRRSSGALGRREEEEEGEKAKGENEK